MKVASRREGVSGMYGLKGDQASFGGLVGFPLTGTRMVWFSDGRGEWQRGYYPSQVGRVRKKNEPAFPAGQPGTGFVRHVRRP